MAPPGLYYNSAVPRPYHIRLLRLQERKPSPLEKGGTLSGAAAAGKVCRIASIMSYSSSAGHIGSRYNQLISSSMYASAIEAQQLSKAPFPDETAIRAGHAMTSHSG